MAKSKGKTVQDVNPDLQVVDRPDGFGSGKHSKRLMEWANRPNRYFVDGYSVCDRHLPYGRNGDGQIIARCIDMSTALLFVGLLTMNSAEEERERLERIRKAEQPAKPNEA